MPYAIGGLDYLLYGIAEGRSWIGFFSGASELGGCLVFAVLSPQKKQHCTPMSADLFIIPRPSWASSPLSEPAAGALRTARILGESFFRRDLTLSFINRLSTSFVSTSAAAADE